MGLQTEYSIILGYVSFVLVLGVFVNIGAPAFLENLPLTPTFPSTPAVWDYLTFPIANIGYFFYIMAITCLTYPLLGALITGYSVVILYIMIGLLRGGH
jgi:hypothetical protein